MAEKNPGSIWRFEKDDDWTFKRACFTPKHSDPRWKIGT
ncbi:hypothetical protein F444_11529 [Phytophthora nicotianae P1976]|uniref:Uncharacterized protein n=1 Tax=Phytophthora nicotianae P1976 TaxID=1317066 RepID=A0A081A0C8_PHYNI|nr:hypothetical protein F444_11529 [Phytophthora nicotianae P1976]